MVSTFGPRLEIGCTRAPDGLRPREGREPIMLCSLILASVLPSSENDIGISRRADDGCNGLSDTELSSEFEASEMVVGTRRGGFWGFSSSCCMKKRASEKIL